MPPAQAKATSEKLGELAEGSVLDKYLTMSEQLIGEPLIIGNRVELLVDGPATYDAIFGAIGKAEKSILIESYIFDEVEHKQRKLTALLAEKVAAGLEVRVLVDGVGSAGSGETIDAMTAVGVKTCIFNPVSTNWFRPARLNHRDHRKIVVVDGSHAFAGGINFSRVYRSGSAGFGRNANKERLDEGWRDTHIGIEGPGARRLTELFNESWAKQTCAEDAPVPPEAEVAKAGGTVIQVVPSSPDDDSNLTYLSVLGAVTYARKSIDVTMAYFVPDEQLEDALIAAAGRGVRVRMILPAYSDFTGVFHAGRAHYARLLAGGVQIFEQENAFLHAKTVVIDDIWSAVGSTNWDWRSFVLNDEVTVVVIDEGFAGKMLELFGEDLGNSSEITAAGWEERPLRYKFLEKFWTGFERLL